MRRLVIVGGSDAGISVILRARELDTNIQVTMIVEGAFPNYSICGLTFYLSGEVPDYHRLAHCTREEITSAGIDSLITSNFTSLRPVVLLRSVAVNPVHRRLQLGRALALWQVRDAQHPNVYQVYPLSETANEYFPHFGFCLIDRSVVEPTIQCSVKWEVACVSTQAMVLYLGAT